MRVVLLAGAAALAAIEISGCGLATPHAQDQTIASADSARSAEARRDESAPGPPATSSAKGSARGATKRFDFEAPAQPPSQQGDCSFAGLDVDAQYKVFAAGAYAGSELGFQIDQSGSDAGRIDVAVNQPDIPVVLMLGSYDPTVWQIGWTEGTRLLAVLVSGYHRQVVTGLPRDTPLIVSTYDNKGPCGHFYVTAEKASTLNPIARRVVGRPVDMVYPAQAGRVVVGKPLGAGMELVTDASAVAAASFRIADSEAAGEAGLAYAVSQGWLRKADQSDADAWLAAKHAQPQADVPPIAGGRTAGRISMHNGYVALRAFKFPEGLYGAHSATIFVPKGVPRPTGNPGHSTIYDFNTLSCTGAICDSD